jgi:formate dehydrogenase
MLALARLASRRSGVALAARALHAATPSVAHKVVAVLYPDPVAGYPPAYARDTLPSVTMYPDGFEVPRLKDAAPGTLLGCVSGELGLRPYLASRGDAYVVLSDKDGPDSALDAELADADVLITTPFWPAYIDAQRLSRASKLKLLLTAGVGSDHIDLAAAAAKGVTVAEATHSNSVSVAEHAVMTILTLVRNFVPAHLTAVTGGWHVADLAARSYDLERMAVGTVGAGRIGLAVLRRLAPFDVELHYTDRRRLPGSVEQALNLHYHASTEEMVPHCDVVTINAPLHSGTEHLFDAAMLRRMRRGAYLVNTARGKICDRDAIVAALETGHLAGYGGDVWHPQPAPASHQWRKMPHHAMTPHMSGTTLSAQARYAAGVRDILERYFAGKAIPDEYLIVDRGKLAGVGAQSYGPKASVDTMQGTGS